MKGEKEEVVGWRQSVEERALGKHRVREVEARERGRNDEKGGKRGRVTGINERHRQTNSKTYKICRQQ